MLKGEAFLVVNADVWTDLGVILSARPNSMHCNARNGFFAGGHGDASCMLDKDRKYMYFFFGAYAGEVTEQGGAERSQHDAGRAGLNRPPDRRRLAA